jgi:hypothetical protein
MRKIGLVLFLIVLSIGCSRSSAPPKETPDMVVNKYYGFISTGGMRALSEAYRLTTAKENKLTEDRFKDIVRRYPEGMKIKILGTDVQKNIAKVTMEMNMPSSFGDYVTQNYVYLKLDKETNNWKIDFTGELQDDTVQPEEKKG